MSQLDKLTEVIVQSVIPTDGSAAPDDANAKVFGEALHVPSEAAPAAGSMHALFWSSEPEKAAPGTDQASGPSGVSKTAMIFDSATPTGEFAPDAMDDFML